MSKLKIHLLLLALVLTGIVPGSLSAQRPNVLFIMVDDLRAELGCYGAEHIRSPNIDRFAKSALQFNRAYCQQAVCNASRSSLMTGMLPERIGVTTNHVHFRDQDRQVVTLPQLFKNHQYHCQAIGKIYHGVFHKGASKTTWDTLGDPESWSVPETRFGPRYYYTEKGIEGAKLAYEKMYRPKSPRPNDWTSKLVFGLATESPDIADNELFDGKVADAAIAALRERKQSPDDPFFLAVGFIKPHSPYIAPKKYFQLYDPGKIELAENQDMPKTAYAKAGHRSGELRRYSDQPNQGPFSIDQQKRVRHAYYACISFVDAQIGRVLDELERLKLSENTIVVLVSDHGYHLGEKGLWGKTTNFEWDTRVPLIVRVPGMKTAGNKTDSIVELVDLYPTLRDLAGLTQPPNQKTDGVSFKPILENSQKVHREYARSQFPRGKIMGYSVRNKNLRQVSWRQNQNEVAKAAFAYSGSSSNEIPIQDAVTFLDNMAIEKSRVENQSSEFFEKAMEARSERQEKLTEIRKQDKKLGNDRTGFEEFNPGEFKPVRNLIGYWDADMGHASINQKLARSGKNCLHIVGGKNRTLELTFSHRFDTTSRLTFWAERWTKQSPFEFRIEKRVDGKWSEIYNGDRQIKVGRGYPSFVSIDLDDPSIDRIRFRCTSHSGVLIDDLAFVPKTKQKIDSVSFDRVTLPALVGKKYSPLFRVHVKCSGSMEPIRLSAMKIDLDPKSPLRQLGGIRIFETGREPVFHSKKPITKLQPAVPFSEVDTGVKLNEGDNFFWVCTTLKKQFDIDQQIRARCNGLLFSDGAIVNNKDTSYFPQRTGIAIRDGGDDGVHTYRIPGLATTPNGTLIAVYDVRRRSGGDLPGDIDVGMSRSTDGGRSWEKMKIIMDMGDDPRFRFDGIGDPAVLVDQKNGTIWVASTWSHGNRSWRGSGPGLEPDETGQFMLVKSEDDGKTWSQPINITKQVKKPEWCFILQGPGKGITMQDGTLVFAAQYQDPPDNKNPRRHRLPHSTIIYSRDHGKTWQVGEGAYDDTTEAQVVEIQPGKLMLNARYNRAGKRVVAITEDMGKTWTEHETSRKTLIEPGACMASLINVSRELGESKTDWLLFSNPNSPQGRKKITIKASNDLGKTWPENRQLLLDEGLSAGYSCLSMIDDKTIGILYECSQSHLAFQRIPLNDVLNPSKPGLPNQSNEQKLLKQHQSVGHLRKRLEHDRYGELTFDRVFGDHMVLQRDQPVRVWGRAPPASLVRVQIANIELSAKADQDGNWMANSETVKLRLPSNPFQEITFSATDGKQKINLKNVVVGDVWLLAGQSNMEWPLQKTDQGKTTMVLPSDRQLRLMHFKGALRGSHGEYDESATWVLRPDRFATGKWQIDSPDSRRDFSGVGYYFGQALRKANECPIGLIHVASGGTPVESWISNKALRQHAKLRDVVDGDWVDNPVIEPWCRKRAVQNLDRGYKGEFSMLGDRSGVFHPFKPGYMNRSAIEPFIGLKLCGIAWYQGESNAESAFQVKRYHESFPLLVDSLRKQFGQAELPFLQVQLPAMNRPHWPAFRQVQLESTAMLKRCAMAVTIDTGVKNDVHPREKKIVGQRLAQVWQQMQKDSRKSDPSAGLKVLSKGSSLVVESSLVPFDVSKQEKIRHFELAGADGKYFKADAIFDGSKIKVHTESVSSPMAIRYAWIPFPHPKVNLYFENGMPVSPFQAEVDPPSR